MDKLIILNYTTRTSVQMSSDETTALCSLLKIFGRLYSYKTNIMSRLVFDLDIKQNVLLVNNVIYFYSVNYCSLRKYKVTMTRPADTLYEPF